MTDPAEIARECRACRYVRTFAARADERERFGFGETGYGCRYPGYEGYTSPTGTCPAFQNIKEADA